MLTQTNVLPLWTTATLPMLLHHVSANLLQSKEIKKRVIGYVPFWEDCPLTDMTDHYTHIVIAFASTYKWEDGVKNCNWDEGQICRFKPQLICGDSQNPVDSNNIPYIDAWQNAGKKVILSVGGAGMGGHWLGDPNGCWDDCIAAGTGHVVDQLVDMVEENKFDGVDINYEYFFDTPERQEFLVGLTNGLRQMLGDDKIISHAPANGASDASGTGTYYTEEILKNVADVIDYVKPQYFNNNNKLPEFGLEGFPGTGRLSALQHYENLVTDVFSGDASKVVFGFCAAFDSTDCNQQCQEECVTGTEAAEIMASLAESHPCNGGAGFWVTTRDTNGSWSMGVSEVVENNDSCSNPTVQPTKEPTAARSNQPTMAPTTGPTDLPTNQPSVGPTNQPTNEPSKQLTLSPTPSPTMPATHKPTVGPSKIPTTTLKMGTCGDGTVGNGLCEDSHTCCSRWGWCGTTTHCTSDLNQGTCGGGNRGNGICPNAKITRECCSLNGECGTSTEYCNSGFCNWGDDGTAGTATCDKSEGGTWCNKSADKCENDCSGKWCYL